jgi:MFS family permease
MMFVTGTVSFYTLRFLLGAAEAGFFPGILFYLTRWFPARERARTIAAFMTAVLIAGVVGSPISGTLLSLRAGGLAGWQWLFLLEGLPSIALGFVVLRVLPERPQDATWLTAAERLALVAGLEEDGRAIERESPTVAGAMANSRTWLLAGIYFTIPVTLYGIGFWLPQIVKTASAGTDFQVGALSAIPYTAGAAAMIIAGRHSDRTGERRKHVAIAAFICAASLVVLARVTGAAASIAMLSFAMAGLASMMGPFWAVATATTRGVAGAAAIALINSVGNTGGFVGPYLLGAVNDATHSFAAGLMVIAGIVAAGGLLILAIRE